jgi:nucleoside-diphosphate-sugar epimerase
MRVFVTGATGWVGSAVIEELRAAGHTVTGLARSDAAAAALASAGIAVHRGSIEDLESLRAGAVASDAVIHTAFNHDFSRFAENGAAERSAIDALGSALAGTDRPLIVTSGVALIAPGRTITEADVRDPDAVPFPRNPESAAAAAAARGVRVSVIRLARPFTATARTTASSRALSRLPASTAHPRTSATGIIGGLASTAATRHGSTVSPSNALRSTPCITRSPTRAYRSAR